jgi:hypothetical protein
MGDAVGRNENNPEKPPSGFDRSKIALEEWKGQPVPGTDLGQERDSNTCTTVQGWLNRSISSLKH